METQVENCRHENCGANLRSDNDCGFCREHRHFYVTEASSTVSASGSSPPKQLTWPMVLCSYCNASPVNALMNKKRKCQKCSKVAKTNNNSNGRRRQRDEYVPFSFADGCKRAFRGSSSVDGQVISAEKAVNSAILMDYIPIAMHLQRDKSVSSPVMDSFAMVTQSFINDMHAAGMSFDTKHDPGTQLQVTLQLPEEEEIVQAEPHRDAEYNIEAILKKNGFGKLCKMTGAHEQPDNKLLDILNMEFHEKPELLAHIAELLANGIVRCKNVLIKVLTVEAYSRHASVDIH